MAIADRAVATGESATATITYSHTVAGTADLCLWVYVNNFQTGGGDVPNTVTYAGAGMTAIGNYMAGGGNDNNISLWVLVAPATGANDVVVSFTGSHDGTAMSISYSGVDQTTPNDAPSINDVVSATPSRAITSETDDMVVDFVGWWSGAGATATGAGTEQLENFNGTGLNSCAVADAAGAASVTMGWSITGGPGDTHGQIGFNVNAAGEEGPTFTPQLRGVLRSGMTLA